MAKKTPGTVPQSAPENKPVAPVNVAPVVTPTVMASAAPVYRPKTIERQGSVSAPYTIRMPQVRGGICEWCGVLDPNLPATEQYKICPHYRAIGQLRCSYCPDTKDPDDVIYHSVLNVHGHPNDPDKLVVVCDSTVCVSKHFERFKVSVQ